MSAVCLTCTRLEGCAVRKKAETPPDLRDKHTCGHYVECPILLTVARERALKHVSAETMGKVDPPKIIEEINLMAQKAAPLSVPEFLDRIDNFDGTVWPHIKASVPEIAQTILITIREPSTRIRFITLFMNTRDAGDIDNAEALLAAANVIIDKHGRDSKDKMIEMLDAMLPTAEEILNGAVYGARKKTTRKKKQPAPPADTPAADEAGTEDGSDEQAPVEPKRKAPRRGGKPRPPAKTEEKVEDTDTTEESGCCTSRADMEELLGALHMSVTSEVNKVTKETGKTIITAVETIDGDVQSILACIERIEKKMDLLAESVGCVFPDDIDE